MNTKVYVPICIALFWVAKPSDQAVAAIDSAGAANDAQTSIGYNPTTGEVFIDAPSGVDLTSFRVESTASVFTGAPAENLILPPGGFDRDDDEVIFKSTVGSTFGSLSFGNVAQTGLTEVFLLSDWSVTGSLDVGGGLGDVDLIYGARVPEPTGLATAAIFLLSSVHVLRWRSRRVRSN